MPRIKTKNSTTSATEPASGSLLQGEVAINIADKRLFVGDSSGNPVEITNQGVTSVFGSVSGIYVTQATGSTTIGLDPDVFVSGSLHVSGVLTQSPAAINIFASEDPTTSESRMINMQSYGNNYAEINVANDGSLILKSQTNVVNINPTGTSAVYLDTASSTGYLYTTPTDIRIGGPSAVTTFPGDVTITKTLTVDHIVGDMDGQVLKACKNTDSIALRKGDPVFIAGVVGSTDTIEVQLARSDTAGKMPAIGLSSQDLAVNATGYVTIVGVLDDVNTSAFSVGNSVFVNSTGWITNVRPTGASILVQNIGRIGRVNSNNGQIIVLGPGRTNDVPNNILASGTLTLGTPDIITPLAGTASVFNTNVARVNIGSSASGVLIGNATGVVVVGDIAVNNGAITTTAATATLFNATASRVNIGAGASGVQIGHPTGMVVMGNIAVSGSVNTDNILSSGIQLSLNDKVNNRVAIGDFSGNGNQTYIYLRDNASVLEISNPFGDIVIGDPLAVDSGYIMSYNSPAGYLDGGNSSLTNFSTGSFSGLLTASGISATGTIAATFNGLVDMNFNTLVEPTLKYYNEVLASPSISANVLTLDLSTAQVFTVSLNADITTFTISNAPATANRSIGFTLIFTADGTARTVTWGAAVKWANNDPPALTSANGKKDILSFVSPDGGTNWYGFIGGLNF